MMTVYIEEQGAIIQKAQGALVVRRQGETVYRMPLAGIERLVLVGHVQISTQALKALLEQGVDVSLMGSGGRLQGKLCAIDNGNIFLRLAQHERFRDMEYRIGSAKAIVHSKINTQILGIRRHRWEDDHAWIGEAAQLETLRDSLVSRTSLDEIRGVEGIGSRVYFGAMARMVKYLRFDGRSRRPADDEVNALLNLGYTMLTNECVSLLDAEGLDPALGFFHGIAYGRQSLSLDFIETFRQPIVDRLVIRLVNWRMLQENDFETDAKIGFKLTSKGLHAFFKQYEKHILEGDPSRRVMLRREAQRFRNAVLQGIVYEPREMG